jgi:hypothetical protein
LKGWSGSAVLAERATPVKETNTGVRSGAEVAEARLDTREVDERRLSRGGASHGSAPRAHPENSLLKQDLTSPRGQSPPGGSDKAITAKASHEAFDMQAHDRASPVYAGERLARPYLQCSSPQRNSSWTEPRGDGSRG